VIGSDVIFFVVVEHVLCLFVLFCIYMRISCVSFVFPIFSICRFCFSRILDFFRLRVSLALNIVFLSQIFNYEMRFRYPMHRLAASAEI